MCPAQFKTQFRLAIVSFHSLIFSFLLEICEKWSSSCWYVILFVVSFFFSVLRLIIMVDLWILNLLNDFGVCVCVFSYSWTQSRSSMAIAYYINQSFFLYSFFLSLSLSPSPIPLIRLSIFFSVVVAFATDDDDDAVSVSLLLFEHDLSTKMF